MAMKHYLSISTRYKIICLKSELYIICHKDKDDNVPVDNKTLSLGMKYVF